MLRLLTVLGLTIVAACSPGAPPGDDALIKDVEVWRAERERYMRDDPGSPIPADKKSVLLPLRWYAPDPSFVVPAALTLSNNRPVVQMPTSTGEPRNYELVGSLSFTLQGQKHTLGAFVEEGQPINTLFVPFADQTTGTETYPAGRYLELTPTASGVYMIDFNKAYNPFCAYNNAYECPFPPPSNRLKLAVRAGEKLPADGEKGE